MRATWGIASVVVAVLGVGGTGCSCGENRRYSARGEVQDGGHRLRVAVEARVSSGFVRSGMLTTRSYGFQLDYDSRGPVSFESYQKGQLLGEEALRAAVREVGLRVAPDGQRFAVDLRPFGAGIALFHLLPQGPPFRAPELDETLALASLEAIDWGRVSPPAAVLDAHLRAKLAALGDKQFCLRDGTIDRPLELNALDPQVSATLLAVWPECGELSYMVGRVAAAPATPVAWKERLRAKADEHLRADRHTPYTVATVFAACQALKDADCLAKLSRAGLRHWPHPSVHGDLYVRRAAELPADVKAKLIELARAKQAAADAQAYEKEYAAEVLRTLR